MFFFEMPSSKPVHPSNVPLTSAYFQARWQRVLESVWSPGQLEKTQAVVTTAPPQSETVFCFKFRGTKKFFLEVVQSEHRIRADDGDDLEGVLKVMSLRPTIIPLCLKPPEEHRGRVHEITFLNCHVSYLLYTYVFIHLKTCTFYYCCHFLFTQRYRVVQN